MYYIGYDIGSSSIKAALLNSDTNEIVAKTTVPDREMAIDAPHPGWAEQDPEIWWDHVITATHTILRDANIKGRDVSGIGISYQMHGLIVVDRFQKPLRPAIIWCDSRAIPQGDAAEALIGSRKSLEHHLNTPGNFTISKLLWVREHEPEVFEKVFSFMLPGDFIVMKMSDFISSTITGFSEMVLWDFKEHLASDIMLYDLNIDPSSIPPMKRSFGKQAKLYEKSAETLGLEKDILISYRAGDQPNNAFSLGVMEPGQVAATGGTSGVVYAIMDRLNYDPDQRVNCFAHVNHDAEAIRIGVLLCINGAGSAYAWMRNQVSGDQSYEALAKEVDAIPIGSDGVSILPFGNGAERMLSNRDIGSSIHGLNWNRHTDAHLYRATLEGIACAYVYGMRIMQDMGIDVSQMRVGNDNLFQSAPFSEMIATLMNCQIDVINTSGAEGAARGAAIGQDAIDFETAFEKLKVVKQYLPDQENAERYKSTYDRWHTILEKQLNNH